MICNRNGITSVGRWEFVKAFVEDFVAILCGNPFCHTFCHKKWSWEFRWNFVKDFVASTQVWRNFNEVLDEISTIFLWQNVVAKRFATILLIKKNRWTFVKDFVTSTQVWRNLNEFFDEILTNFFLAKCCGKTFCHKENFGQNAGFWQNFPCGKRFATTFATKKKRQNFVKFCQKNRSNFVKLELK